MHKLTQHVQIHVVSHMKVLKFNHKLTRKHVMNLGLKIEKACLKMDRQNTHYVGF